MADPTASPAPAPEVGRLHALWSGFRLPFEGARLLLRLHGVKRVAVLPLLVNFICYLGIVFAGFWLLWHWDWSLHGQAWHFWGGFGAWLQKALEGFLGLIKWSVGLPLLFLVCYFTFNMVGMVLASPFNDILSERIEIGMCAPQHRPALPLHQHARIIALGVLDALSILVRQLGAMLLALPFLLIPIVGFLPLFLASAYYTGLGFADVAMARNDLRNAHKRPMIRQHRWQFLGLGIAMELMFLLPLLGLFILPLGVAAGTLLYCRFDWESALRRHLLPAPARFVVPKLLPRDPPPRPAG